MMTARSVLSTLPLLALAACAAASSSPTQGADTSGSECSKRACAAGHCGVEYAPKDTGLVMQAVGDCKKLVCDGKGGTSSVVDDGDVPDDANPCTLDACDAGVPSHASAQAGTACGQGLQCDGSGACLGCLAAGDCPGKDDECRKRTCAAGACGLSFTSKGTPIAAQSGGDCKAVVCDGAGNQATQAEDGDVPVDGKQCTTDQCNAGVPSNPPTAQGAACSQNGGKVCDGKGVCAQCLTAADCPGQDGECQARACNAGTCGVTNQPKSTPLKAQLAGDCKAVVCDGAGASTTVNDDKDVPVDGNDCTQDACAAGAPSNPPAAAQAACKQNGGKVCDGKGACVDCAVDADCASLLCLKNVCAAATCNDGAKNGDETSVDCGGSCTPCPTVILLAGGSSTAYAAEYHPGGAWIPTPLAGVTVDGVALGALASGEGVGLLRFTKPNDPQDNVLMYTVFAPATQKTPSSWSAFAAIGPAVTSQGAPSIDVSGATAQVAFHGMDYKHYYAAWSGAWTPPAETVGAGGAQSFGPSPPAVAARGGNATIVFHNGASNPANATTSRDRTNGAWQGPAQLATGAAFATGPAICAPASGPELVAVWARADAQILAATRSAGAWSAPVAVPNATTLNRPALAALAGSGAVLAFRGTDGKLYTSTFAGGAFGAPAGIAVPNVAMTGVPAVARGTGGAAIEIAYVGTDGKAYHARYVGNAWQPVTSVGGANLVSVAIAAMP